MVLYRYEAQAPKDLGIDIRKTGEWQYQMG
jgi:hypothetical protein